MTTSESRKTYHPLAAVFDALGLPSIDEVIPMPSDVAKDVGVPTPRDLAHGIRAKVEEVRPKLGGRY